MSDCEVELWFDPSCPYTWCTATWLRELAERGRVQVQWHPMSLALLGSNGSDEDERSRRTTAALRVLAAAAEHGGSAAVGALYEQLGVAHHQDGAEFDRSVLQGALEKAGLPAGLVEAAENQRYDDAIRASHEQGQRRVGTESGSPVLSIDGARGFFGPVVAPAPSGAAADTLLEGVRLLGSVSAFSELKTARAKL